MKIQKPQYIKLELSKLFKYDTAQRTLNNCVIVKSENKARDNALNFFERVKRANKCLI